MAPQVLMAILGKDRRAVSTLIAKCPQLLRCDLSRLRRTHEALRAAVGRGDGFAFAMLAHNPRLLFAAPGDTAGRVARLRRCCGLAAGWEREWQALKPNVLEELLNRCARRGAALALGH